MTWYAWLVLAYSEVAVWVGIRQGRILAKSPLWSPPYAEGEEPSAWEQWLRRAKIIARVVLSSVTWLLAVLWEGTKVMWKDLA